MTSPMTPDTTPQASVVRPGRLQGKVCLLMGGGSSSPEGGPSNGQAVALTFAREGARLVVVDMQLSASQATVHQVASAGRSEERRVGKECRL